MKPLCCLSLLAFLLATTASAQITAPTPSPSHLAYEGLLAAHDGAPVADGAYRLTFHLYDADHDGTARWHETQQVSVEDGQFAVELGAVAPLAVPGGWYHLGVEGVDADGVPVSLAADDGLLILKAGTPSVTHSSALSNGIEMRGAEGHGLFVGRADQDGVFVESAGDDGVTVWSAGSPTSSISSSSKNGLEVRAAEGYGLFVGWTDDDGIRVNSAGDDGVVVRHAGSPNTTVVSSEKNGFEVQGAEGNGVYVGWAGEDGVLVEQAGTPSQSHGSAQNNGVEVRGVEGNGVFVGQADFTGLYVYQANRSGVIVRQAGTAGSLHYEDFQNGFEVNGAEDNGVYVGHAGRDGVRVNTADDDGIEIVNAGDIGVRVSNPTHEAAYLQRAINSGAGLRNHVVVIENTAPTTTNGPDVLALKSSSDPAAGGTNFITFFKGDDTAIGAVEGDGSGGVTYKSGAADFAEYLPRLQQGERLEAGDVVGVFNGRITKTTEGASRLMVLTDRAAVLGNMPPDEDEVDYAATAFVGQVSVKVRGSVEAGDWLVASGGGDGTAVAVARDVWRPWEHGPVVGRAWEDAQSSGVHRVRALVGLDGTGDVTPLLEQQQAEMEALKAEVSQLRALVEQLMPAKSRTAQ